MTLEEITDLFRESNMFRLLDADTIRRAVNSFQRLDREGHITYGGSRPPSCATTDVMSQSYNPRTSCTCNGDFPIPKELATEKFLSNSHCLTVQSTLKYLQDVVDRPDECAPDLYTPEKLRRAVHELLLANSEETNIVDTCLGVGTANKIPKIQAPDRRPHPQHDLALLTHGELYPSIEGIKICADARHYFVLGCAVNRCDYGIARAIADAGNDILIGDYFEALDEATLRLLQRSGAAALAYLKLCSLAGGVTEWQYQNLVASNIHARVLMVYRDHARVRLPKGIWGSRMTGLPVQRHIDLGLFNAIMPAAIATGEELTEMEFMDLVSACTLVNDLSDFRSDLFRNSRENPLLRGVKGNICLYIDGLIVSCLEAATKALQSSTLSGIVVMACCNWSVMGTHHKIYELISGVKPVQNYPPCGYASEVESKYYDNLLLALKPYGSLGTSGPSLWKTRADMDKTYAIARLSEDTHKAWLADITRAFLEPKSLRKIVDVVHFEWVGATGDAAYCP
ncbi:uncharacterized protein JN550_001343 [Neoarthrinium moseri]|uniref:uncharacterized protein n=1 Tax=Neoarthrinium moseri TaxID=1658444 RepID=UPI001FDC1094|nr:uncharacterized protein JN550_001343 [Neoarthrinium moseri]KAI1877271.1 hypothetical protein JN550_001343 [Neoarthrinium moseri]